MKKIFFILTVFVLALNSCSSDDNSSSPDNYLIKKVITKSNNITKTATFTYLGNKLVSINKNNGDYDKYTYNDDLVTKIEHYTANVLIDYDTIQYDASENVIATIGYTPTNNFADKTTYTYNSDNTITTNSYTGNSTSQEQLLGRGKIYLTNGNVTLIEHYQTGGTVRITYSYDSKKHSLTNVTGFSKLYPVNIYSKNNIIYSSAKDANGVIIDEMTTDYKYNSNGFPISAISTNKDGNISTGQFFY